MAAIIFGGGSAVLDAPVIDFESDVCAIDDYKLSGTATAANGSIVAVYEHPVLPNSVPFGCAIVENGAWVMHSETALGGRKFEALLIEVSLA